MSKSKQKLFDTRMATEVLECLQKSQKRLPSKYFYDERGSELFEEICKLEEYYPTDAEMEIIRSSVKEISGVIGTNSLIIEFGSGSSRKTRILLNQLEKVTAYVPVDISRNFLLEEASKLREEFPDIDIYPVAADYTRPFEINVNGHADKRVIFFPGSTVGNFRPERAREFLSRSADLLGKNGGLLIGVDMKKDPEILNRAYNDSQGITAKFNKNLLRRMNRELDADFNLNRFEHQAFYSPEEGRVEMHLESLADQSVRVAGEIIEFEEGETIHTENSYKYSPKEFEELISDRYSMIRRWTDSRNYFSLFYFEKS